jgi:hypothetical protein
MNKLEVMQHQALRLITGAVKLTPPASMQVLAMENPTGQYKYQDGYFKTQNGFI